MKNKNYILEKIRSSNSFGELNVGELQKQLDRELAKSNPDYDLVDEITMAILEARKKAVKEIDVQSEIKTIKQKADKGAKRFKCPKWAVAASAACIVLAGVNMVSVAALGTDIISAIVRITKGSVSIGLEEQEAIELPTSENDPYGIKAKCAEYDIYPKIPYYLPEGFELVDLKTEINEVSSDILFFYKKGKIQLNFVFQQYNCAEDIPPIGIPTDTYDIRETKVNGQTMYVLKEDNQFTATFLSSDTIYVITSNKLDYDECQKIIESIK